MEPRLKGCLKAIVLELRRELEGSYDAKGDWQPGDLERRLASIGIRKDRAPVPVDELRKLPKEDREARQVVDAFLKSRAEAGLDRASAVEEFVRQSAYTWANRLLALRCMEARGLIDEVILQKEVYGGRSLQHNRLAKKAPDRCGGEDEGLLATLFDEFERRAKELPLLFNPRAPEVALRPSVAAIKRGVGLLSGTTTPKGQEPATDEVFTAPDALGWAYQYWNTDEKDRVFEKVRTKKGTKIEGAEIIPATCIYTEPYIVKFLVQNSLGALWMGMRPSSKLASGWEYYVRDADRASVQKKLVRDITFLDPACGSGHFLIEAFDLFYAMYEEEGEIKSPAEICAGILERNLYGIDIDERAVQIAALALVMKAKERAPDFVPRRVNLVATNIRLPAGKDHLEAFLRKHPDDTELKPALLAIFEGLAHADELGSLLQIEEPVDRELKSIRRRLGGQLTLTGPKTEADWEAWKSGVIERLRQHFVAEADAPDLVTALFGEAGAKGLSLVDVLARRYDVVAANPPYMGSKNMGAIVKKHVERHFSPGKRDLYASFIMRCAELAAETGRVAMVTQQSWMFLRSFADLRAVDDERCRSAPGLLQATTIEALAHLGPHAFTEIGGEVVNTVLFVLARTEPLPEHRLTAFRLVGPKSPEEKDALLREALHSHRLHPVVSRPLQTRFGSIPQVPLCYWLRDRFFELLAGRTLGDVANVCQGLVTGDEMRFTRFSWEAPHGEWARMERERRWVPFEKGGGYGRWFGHHFWVVDWQHNGARIRSTPGPRVQNEQHYFNAGWTYSYMASGSVGLRVVAKGTITCDLSAGVFPREAVSSLASVLNARLSSYIVRSITPKIQLRESYVSRIPLPEHTPPELARLQQLCLPLKRNIVALDPSERAFRVTRPAGSSLGESWRYAADEAEGVAAVLHALEGLSERDVFKAYGVDGEDLAAVLGETGTPAGWLPIIAGYDAIPDLPQDLEIPEDLLDPLAREPRRTLSAEETAALTRRLRGLYEGGPGAPSNEEDAGAADSDEDEENEGTSGARIPIPAETFLEQISEKVQIHPVSVYWLLRELREKDGVVCGPELRRFVEDYMSVTALRLLGHRWPREVEAGEASPAWADRDGIIALTEGTAEPTLLARIRERLAVDFGTERASTIEREFGEIVGKSLGAWLASDLFPRHISQFRKRPIAWQLTSSPGTNERRRGRGAGRNAPVFSCLLYYHRLDADLLPKLRSQYVGPLRSRFQTELAGLEKIRERTADQDAQRVELEAKIEQLKTFDARVEEVIVRGFDCTVSADAIAKEPLDKWTSHDGRSAHPSTQDAFLAEERRYAPDLNDGVRVNVAPLQKAGLLSADVLAPKDVEKAISDRAEWRADECRWCREGKLPRPGWWPAEGTTETMPRARSEARR